MSEHEHIKVMLTEARGYTILSEHLATAPQTIVTNECTVVIETVSKINLSYIKELILQCLTQGIQHCILIHNGTVTSNVKTVVRDCSKPRVELFSYSLFKFALMEHSLLPQSVRKIDPEETKSLKASDVPKLPKLVLGDALVRYFDFQVNDVIEIVRRDGFTAHRLVVLN